MFNFSSVLQELYPGDFYSIFRNIFPSQEGQIPPRDLLLRVLQYILICRNAKGLNMNGMFANVLKINDIAMATITGTSPLRIIYAAKSFFREKKLFRHATKISIPSYVLNFREKLTNDAGVNSC